MPAILNTAAAPDLIFGWPLWGHFMGAAEFSVALREGSDEQYVVMGIESSEILGLVQTANTDEGSGTCRIDVLLDRKYWLRGWALEGFVLLLRHAFDDLNMRKVYLYASDASLARFRSAVGRWIEHEATLRRHLYADGDYQDLHVLAVSRATWETRVRSRLAAVVGERTTSSGQVAPGPGTQFGRANS